MQMRQADRLRACVASLDRQMAQFALNSAAFGIVSDILAGKEFAPLELALRMAPAVLGYVEPCIFCTAEPVVSCVDSRVAYCSLHWLQLCAG